MDESENKKFYAAYLTSKGLKLGPLDLISTEKEKIIELIKKHNGSRFKSFDKFEDALKFVLKNSNESSNENGDDENHISIPTNTIEVLYQSVDVYQLNNFKRLIEAKNLDSVQKLVEKNPRYLISNHFDSPTIIVQGARYNAIHLAIRNKFPELLNYVLETISSLDFVGKMNENISQESLIEARNHILDLYLNTPDKICFNTPLHMACKYGFLDCISILVSYVPILDTEKLNKQNKLPYELVLDKNLRDKIYNTIYSSTFITVLKLKDNLDKKISKMTGVGKKILESNIKNMDKRIQVSAIVGPMTMEKSKTFYNVIKSPQKCSAKQRSIRLKDPRHGLERVIYELSAQFNVPYAEYWSFIDGFSDFSSDKDLEKLENYFSFIYISMCLKTLNFSEENDDNIAKKQIKNDGDKTDDNEKEEYFDARNNYDIDNTDNDDNDNTEDDDDNDEVFCTAPSSPTYPDSEKTFSSKDFEFYIEGKNINPIDYDLHLILTNSIGKDQINKKEFAKKYYFISRWYHLVTKNIERQTNITFETNNGGDNVDKNKNGDYCSPDD